jgi:hypothetical protein
MPSNSCRYDTFPNFLRSKALIILLEHCLPACRISTRISLSNRYAPGVHLIINLRGHGFAESGEHIEVLLKQCYRTPRCQSVRRRRRYSTGPLSVKEDHEVKDVAVLGGGITGLASAFYLSQELPNAKITLTKATGLGLATYKVH